jgi:hypothetical protein
VPAYRARAEFRRWSRGAPWVLAGVVVADRFVPVEPGVERIRARLPEPGLVGWAPLPSPIVATSASAAGEPALDVARATWPERLGAPVPFPSGAPE